MSGKNQAPIVMNWQSTSPVTGFLPLNNNTQGKGSVPSGVIGGTMSGTSTIYSQILDVSRMDNFGFQIDWTGSPTGVISFWTSNDGAIFHTLTFTTAQPAGQAGGMNCALNQLPFKYIYLQYVNSSGTGVLTSTAQVKDLN